MRKLKFKVLGNQRWPLYRNFKLLKFNKKKWHFFKRIIQNKSLDGLNNLDPNFSPLFLKSTTFPSVIRKRLLFKNNLLLQKRLRYNDIFLKQYQLKALFLKNKSYSEQFLVDLNSRLDMLLYKTRLFSSISSLRQFLKHEGVLINNKLVYEGNYSLKEGDVILFQPNRRNFYRKYFSKFYNIQVEGLYNILEIDYSIFCFIVKDLESSVLLKTFYKEFYEEMFWAGRLFR